MVCTGRKIRILVTQLEIVEMDERISLSDAMGLKPWRTRWQQAKVALKGQDDVPASQFGLSSLRLLQPQIGARLWRGKPFIPRQVILTNLFNHQQTPIAEGWSVRRTQVEDFRGRKLTYDSHNGTDLSIPLGCHVFAAAEGIVVQVVSEFNRGGLKVFIDHGAGLMTSYAHLARSLVEPGDIVQRNTVIGISGYSGLDGFVTFPFGVPHVHFNTWLNGEPVDPFPRKDEVSLWRGGEPKPADGRADSFTASVYDAGAVDEAIEACTTESTRNRLRGERSLARRAALTLIEMNYYPTRFSHRPCLYAQRFERLERLSLPFSSRHFDKTVFLDEL